MLKLPSYLVSWEFRKTLHLNFRCIYQQIILLLSYIGTKFCTNLSWKKYIQCVVKWKSITKMQRFCIYGLRSLRWWAHFFYMLHLRVRNYFHYLPNSITSEFSMLDIDEFTNVWLSFSSINTLKTTFKLFFIL